MRLSFFLGMFNFCIGGLRATVPHVRLGGSNLMADLNEIKFVRSPCNETQSPLLGFNVTARDALQVLANVNSECVAGQLVYDSCQAAIGALQILVAVLMWASPNKLLLT